MNGYEGLSEHHLRKIYKRKIDQLIYARENGNKSREEDVLREMYQIENLLKDVKPPKKRY